MNVVYQSSIHRVKLISDLGIVFDSSPRFNSHIDNIIAKAFKMAGFDMRQCCQFKNVEVLKKTYYAMVRSHLEYCVWWYTGLGSSISGPSKRIERMQSRFMTVLLHKLTIDCSTLYYGDRLILVGLDNLEICE